MLTSTSVLITSEDFLRYLEPVILAVREALDNGISQADLVADLYFADGPRDSHLYAHLLRKKTRDDLLVRVANDGSWFLSGSSLNSAIQITRGPVVLKVRMSDGGLTPHPGHSKSQRSFYVQPSLGLAIDDVATPTGHNLILHYQITPHKKILMDLSKPRAPWGYKAPAQLEWSRRVATTADSPIGLRFQPAEETIGLDIERRDIRFNEA